MRVRRQRRTCTAPAGRARCVARSRASRAAGAPGPARAETSGAAPKPPYSRSKLCSSRARHAASGSAVSAAAVAGAGLRSCSAETIWAAGTRSSFEVLAVVGGDLRQQVAKRRQTEARFAREIGAAEERPLIVVHQKHRQRPTAAAAGQHLVRELIQPIEVGTLLAVDLDVDVQLVHRRRGGRILERFVRHHVAPVAGRIADRQQDRLALDPGAPERLGRPTDTSRPGCARAGADTGWFRSARRLTDCAVRLSMGPPLISSKMARHYNGSPPELDASRWRGIRCAERGRGAAGSAPQARRRPAAARRASVGVLQRGG